MITVYVFNNVPPAVKGISRDLRALWALEETGFAYRIHPLDGLAGDLKKADYLRVNPFGMAPSIEDDGFRLFESAAVVLYLAEKAGRLIPKDAKGRALASQWAFAALNTLEPPLVDLFGIDKFHADKAWAKERRPARVEAARGRLAVLDKHLAGRPYLMGDDFAAPDILMTTVLGFGQHTDLFDTVPNVVAYKTRCEGRPARKKVLAEQEQRLADHAAAGPSARPAA